MKAFIGLKGPGDMKASLKLDSLWHCWLSYLVNEQYMQWFRLQSLNPRAPEINWRECAYKTQPKAVIISLTH